MRRTLFQEFFSTEAAGGAVLVICAACALIVANSRWADAYHALWTMPIGFTIGSRQISLTAHEWINDGLMVIFFLLVGLEIKRELLVGELASPNRAAVPIVAAVGGMLVPASIYLLVTGGGPIARGWAIPMATDIAFALGALALVAPRAPTGLKVFLSALAIVDDMGAIVVIACFYTGRIVWPALGMAGVVVLCLLALNRLRVRRIGAYLVPGLALWWFVHESGVHATIAGVLLAFTLPMSIVTNAEDFSSMARFSAYVVMPLFALSNAAITFKGATLGPVTAAVALGLSIGKPLGITLAVLTAIRSRRATLPRGVTWSMVHGTAWLGGIGFTMSLFIAALAFEGSDSLDAAKIGILTGTLVSGVIGSVVLRRATR